MSDDEILEPRMKEKEDEFKEEEALKVDKSQENQQQQPTESNIDIPTLQSRKRSHEEEGSSDFAPQMNTDIKRIKLTAESIPNWLIEVLAWIKRTEMADSSLSTSHWIFKRLCWLKLHGRKVKAHRVKRLMSLRDSESPNPRSKLMLCVSSDNVEPQNYTTIPIANIKPPEYITGFNLIDLRFLDGPILEFMKNMLPYFDPIRLIFLPKNSRIGPIRRLLSILAPKIRELLLQSNFSVNLCDFNRLFPGIIEEIQSITYIVPTIADWDLLLQWLNTERADGKPKVLGMYYRNILNTVEERDNFVIRVTENLYPRVTMGVFQLRNSLFCITQSVHRLSRENDGNERIPQQKDTDTQLEFLHSKQKAAFIILLGFAYMPNDTLENEATGEVLSICQGEYVHQNGEIEMQQYLVRHPKGMEWTNFVKEMFWNKEKSTDVRVLIEDPPQRKWKCPCSIL